MRDATEFHNDHAKLWDLIKDTKFGMFTHRHDGDMLHSHPLTTQNKSADENGTLYFFISKSSEIAQSIAADPVVNVAYANTDADSYVSVAGQAAMSDDAAKKKELFTKLAEAWFPKGVDDPDLGLLMVQIDQAEYWDVQESKMVQIYKMMKAAATGKPPTDMGEHKKINAV